MDNPFEIPVPADKLARVHDFARDLAWGALNGLWDAQITFYGGDEHSHAPHIVIKNSLVSPLNGLIGKYVFKWNNPQPQLSLLVSFGYLQKTGERGDKKKFYDGVTPRLGMDYILTDKAFALLEKPYAPPSVFISYEHDQSSTLALLIEARLKLRDNNINIFIDKLLVGGVDWRNLIESTIRKSRYFICLINRDTLNNSKMVQQEIDWALDANCTFIAICYKGYSVADSSYPNKLKRHQAIMVPSESAKGYESAISDLLNSLGYSTY